MARDDLQEPLQSFPALFDHIVREPVCEDLIVSDRWPASLWGRTLPGRGGMFTLVDSRSSISLKASKSEYRRRTDE
jgi:hypothetical protein